MLVSSVPLSLTTVFGRLRWAMSRSNSRATRNLGKRRISDQAEAFPGEVIDDAQDADASAIGQRIADKVHGPALVRPDGMAIGPVFPRLSCDRRGDAPATVPRHRCAAASCG